MNSQTPEQRNVEIKTDERVFDNLKSLVGSWEGTSAAGRPIKVAYTLHAKDSVLMEAWTLGPTSDALTLYHMNDATLMATHYCPLCNQPRLVLSEVRSISDFVFAFSSATNLSSLDVAHQHSFELRLLGNASFWRSETYIESNVQESEGVTYHRVANQDAL
jgi:hypothetical protein